MTAATKTASLSLTYTDDAGTIETIYGDTVQEIAEQLDADVCLNSVPVHNEAGFVRGWVSARDSWRCN